jgi:outer membrane protein TolC
LFFFVANAHTIDFKNALQQTLAKNKELQQQQLDIQNTKLDQKSINKSFLGHVYLSHEITRTNHAGQVFNSKLSSREASFNDFGFNQMNQGNDTQPIHLNYPNDRTHHQSKIAYDINLFNGFKTITQKQMLQLQQKAQQLHLNASKKELSLEVFQAYNQAVVAKGFIQALKKAQQSVQKLHQLATAMHQEGLITSLDIQEIQLQQLNIQSQKTQAHNQFNHAIHWLQFLTSNEQISDVDTFASFEFKLANNNLQSLYKESLQHQEGIAIQHLKLQSMQKNVKLQRGNYYPSIYSHLEYGFNDEHTTLNENKDYYLAMVGIKLDLFHPNTNEQYQKAKIDLQKTQLQLQNQKEALKLQLNTALNELKMQKELLKQQQQNYELAQKVFEKSKKMYENRLIPISTLLQKESSFRQSEAVLLQTIFQKALAQAKLTLFLKEPFTQQFLKDNP